MRFVRIFLLHQQSVFEQRGRSFVWFLYSLIPTSVFLLFWIGAVSARGGNLSGWTLPAVTSYYFLLIVAGSMLIAHIEEDIAFWDIQEGHLSTHLLRPFSYFWAKFFIEIPWRILQGSYGILLCIGFSLFFGSFFQFSRDPLVILLSIIIAILAFVLSFTFKVVLGLSALWLTDSRGLFQVFEAVMVIFGGFVVPLTLLPATVEQVSMSLPFAYMAYYPIVSFQGQLGVQELIRIILIQLIWISLLAGFYKIVWASGRKKFTGVGL